MSYFSEQEERKWKNAHDGELPHGLYKGVLVKNKIHTSQKDGNKSFILTYRVEDPIKYAGEEYSHFLGLLDTQIKFTKQTLKKIGVNVELPLSQIDAALTLLTGTEVEFLLSGNGEYTNCKITDAKPRNQLSESSQADEKDIPF